MCLFVIYFLSYVCLHFFSPHVQCSIRGEEIRNGVLQRKYAIELTLPSKKACCPTKIFLINSFLGWQLQHGYFLKIIDQGTKSSLSAIGVLQICMGNVCQLQGSGNCTVISHKQTKHSFIFQLNSCCSVKINGCIQSHTHAAHTLQCSLQQFTELQKMKQRLITSNNTVQVLL